MAFSLQSLRDGVRLLDKIDPDRQLFGAEKHLYLFAPPLSIVEIDRLEARFGSLPAQYRAFLLEVGARGAGPYYGLLAPEPPTEFEAAVQPDPLRPFGGDAHPLDGTLHLADQGCGGASVLVLAGPHAGEVWHSEESGRPDPEAPSFFAWLETWISRALVEWLQENAARVAYDGPRDPAELEAIDVGFELLVRDAPRRSASMRALGYLHARERRWDDARAAFERCPAVSATEKNYPLADASEPLRHLDLARMFYVMEAYDEAVKEAERGLVIEKMRDATRDLLRSVLGDAFSALGEHDKAIVVLDARAAERTYSFDLHHRLAREHIARGNILSAGAALERAANIPRILGRDTTLDERLAASFEPIIAELHAARRDHEGALLEALVEKIRTAN